MKPEIFIQEDFITIGQLLKKIGFIQTGGGAKFYLEKNKVLINSKKPEGRNSKVKSGDLLTINSNIYIIKKEPDI
ncbi:RNA-binding protein [Mycoplasma agalactiae]|uniref:RNA-binding S4 domain-containing protein n=1 Tax=Mycoplasmopsis agalactiae TaxID=2110 RepID=UPI00145600AC|nr:RNA-binding S4 domain-containing protein [Mycoplasmopsis agalactiae]NLS34596.1 RNA-binding protein [Mycoplasmopsis agalactiae]